MAIVDCVQVVSAIVLAHVDQLSPWNYQRIRITEFDRQVVFLAVPMHVDCLPCQAQIVVLRHFHVNDVVVFKDWRQYGCCVVFIQNNLT